MKVTLDSNVWEKVFCVDLAPYEIIRSALSENAINGYICDSVFRIEAIPKPDRRGYFARPSMGVSNHDEMIRIDGNKQRKIFSLGPDDDKHPGLPVEQLPKFRAAMSCGVKLIRGLAWLGLPIPNEISDQALYVQESEDARGLREQRQQILTKEIWARDVGKALFDKIGGWNMFGDKNISDKGVRKVCAEWADGELIASHYAYHNEILCTEDRGINAGISIFNDQNSKLLTKAYGLKIMRVQELASLLA